MSTKKHGLLALGLALLATSACASIFGFEEITFVADAGVVVPDAPTATTSADTEPPPSTCNSKVAPPRPDVPDGNEKAELTIVLDRFDVGLRQDGGAPTPVGFDLDRTCTTSLETVSCAPGSQLTSGVFTDSVLDKDGGVDNGSFALLQLLSIVYDAFSAAAIERALIDGKFGFLVDIDGYSGAANDSRVGVAFRPTIGLDNGGGKPKLDGTDRWDVDKEFANKSEFFGSTFVDVNGYVRDGVLYATFPSLVLPVQRNQNGNVLRIVLQDVVFSAKVVKVAVDRTDLQEGVLAGKWPVADAIGQVRRFAFDGDEESPLCAQPEFDPQFRQRVCAARDIRLGIASKATDPCDALSVGFGFSGRQSIAAVDRDWRPYRPDLCPPVTCDTPLDGGFLRDAEGFLDATTPP